MDHTDGVHLDKYIDTHKFTLPAVVHEFNSEREEPVTVQVVESLPAEIKPTDIGFHKDHGKEYWTISEDGLVCEIELAPGSEKRTVYGIDLGDSVDPDRLITEPDEFTVSPEKKIPVRGGTRSSATQSTPETEPENPGGPSAPPKDSETESTRTNNPERDDMKADNPEGDDSETDDTPHPAQSSDGEPSSRSDVQAGSEEPAHKDRPLPEDADSLVDQIVFELRNGTASEESLHYLEEQFKPSDRETTSVDARISQLQSDFADLRAYTSALEEFLDERGTAEELLTRLENRVETVDDDISEVESTVAEHDESLSDLQATVQQLQATMDEHSAVLSSLSDDVEALSADVERVQAEIPDDSLEEQVAELESELSEVSEFTHQLKGVLHDDTDE